MSSVTTEPVHLNYASKDWMIERLDRMGLVGTAAAQSRNIVEPIEHRDSDAVALAQTRHQLKYNMDQQVHKKAANDLRNFQSAMQHGSTPAGATQVQAENPNDIWVQPRAHPFYQKDRVHISDQELINANEPWRIYTEVKRSSIKHVNTK